MPIPLPPPQPRIARRAADRPNLLEELRKELISFLNMGHIKPGDRLPSIRALARQKKLDHRIVANAYRSLESEGLVEIRGRSGVIAAENGHARAKPGSPTNPGWVTTMLNEAWQKKIGQKELSMLLTRCLDSSNLCCVCVESNRDQMLAFTTDIESVVGISAIPLYLHSEEGDKRSEQRDLESLRQILYRADVVVTTEDHLDTARSLLGNSGIPLIAARTNPDLAKAIRERVQGSGLTVVAVSEEFGDRLKAVYCGDEGAENIRVVLASDDSAVAGLDPNIPILVTRAALDALPRLAEMPLVHPQWPSLDIETLEELSQAIVSVNLRRMSA